MITQATRADFANFAPKRWAPLEAARAPWEHRQAPVLPAAALTTQQRQLFSSRRALLARRTYTAICEDLVENDNDAAEVTIVLDIAMPPLIGVDVFGDAQGVQPQHATNGNGASNGTHSAAANATHAANIFGPVHGATAANGTNGHRGETCTSPSLVEMRERMRQTMLEEGRPKMARISGREGTYVLRENSYDPRTETVDAMWAADPSLSVKVPYGACRLLPLE